MSGFPGVLKPFPYPPVLRWEWPQKDQSTRIQGLRILPQDGLAEQSLSQHHQTLNTVASLNYPEMMMKPPFLETSQVITH